MLMKLGVIALPALQRGAQLRPRQPSFSLHFQPCNMGCWPLRAVLGRLVYRRSLKAAWVCITASVACITEDEDTMRLPFPKTIARNGTIQIELGWINE